MQGHCDFMKHPISVAGTKALAHDRPMDRGAWDDQGTEGFFINKAPEHHRNCKCCMPATNAIRTSNKVEFFPNCSNLPVPNQLDTVATILLQLKELLQGNETCDPQGGPAHALTQISMDIQSPLGVPARTAEQQTSPRVMTQSNPWRFKSTGETQAQLHDLKPSKRIPQAQ